MAFIVFEGPEASGKTTQIKRVEKRLKQDFKNIFLTREPGGTEVSDSIRALFKKNFQEEILPMTELLLVLASRHQHIEKVINPILLKEKTLILCDRFMDSTYVYQGLLQGLKKETIDYHARPIIKDRLPDLTFVFTLGAKKVLERLKMSRQNTEDRLDNFSRESHQRICQGYKNLILEKPSYPNGNIPKRIEIDANMSKESMTHAIIDAIQKEGLLL